MLHELNPIAKKAKIQLVIETKDDGTMEVIVFFIVKDKSDTSLNIAPIRISGLPEEIDADFSATITQLVSKSLTPIERIAFVEESLKKAEQDSVDKAKSGTTSKTKSKTKTTEKVEEKPKEPATLDMFATVPPKGAPVQGTSTVTGTLTNATPIVEEEEIEDYSEEEEEEIDWEVENEEEDEIEEETIIETDPISERTKERIGVLLEMGFTEKDDQFVRGGLGLAKTYVEKSENAEFTRAVAQLKARIDTSNQANKPQSKPIDPVPPQEPKPKMSFSEFRAGGSEIAFGKPLTPEFVPPVPKPMPMPVLPKTMAQKVSELKKLAQEYGFDPNSIADEQTDESIKFMENHILQNGIKQQ